MKAWLVNEMIKLIIKVTCDEILAEIKGSRCNSVIADEAMDISHNKQMSLPIR